jgi:hypothetical protein
MPRLQRLISESLHVVREARARYRRLAMLWSMGKDSTLRLWLYRKAFLGSVPFPVIHIDTSRKLPEMYASCERLAREWGLDPRVVRNEQPRGRTCLGRHTRVSAWARLAMALPQAGPPVAARAMALARVDECPVGQPDRAWQRTGPHRPVAALPQQRGQQA